MVGRTERRCRLPELLPLDEDAAPRVARVAGERAAHSNGYYDSNSEAYASRTGMAGTPPLLDDFIRAMPRGGVVADLGCGAGRDLASLRRSGLDCVGYDLSPELAALARARSGAPVVVADIRSLRFEPSSLDGVVAIASLLHLEPDEIAATLARIAAWLRPDGLLLATMKEGVGSLLDAEGRRFTLVEPNAWRTMLAGAGLREVGSSGSDADGEVSSSGHPWIATLAGRA